MPRVEASALVDLSLAEAWDAYFDPQGWPEWVDAFAVVIATDGYPLEGGELVWRTGTAGRGEVSERAVAHEPRTLHRVRFEDPTMRGELETLPQALELGPPVGGDRVEAARAAVRVLPSALDQATLLQ